MTSFPITIYHNPKCGTSRNALAMIRAAGYEPEVIEYMRSGWDAGQLRDLFSTMGVAPRDVLRGKGALAGELGLNDANASDEAIMEAMVLHPVLVNRPIVVTPKGARLCRPAEKVFALLDKTPVSFVKENGDTVSC